MYHSALGFRSETYVSYADDSDARFVGNAPLRGLTPLYMPMYT